MKLVKMCRKAVGVIIAVAVSAVLPSTAVASDITFVTDNGNIASVDSADWSGATPASSDRVRFAAASGSITATALSDITFAGILLDKANQTVTLDMRDSVTGGSPRNIRLTDSIAFADLQQQTLNIKGGRWDITGKNLFWRGSTSSYSYEYNNAHHMKVSVSDGAVINVNKLYSGYGPNSHSRIDIAGEGTVVTTGYFRVGNINACYDRIEISGGAEVVTTNTANDAFAVGYSSYSEGSHHCVLVVTGACSRLVKCNGGNGYIAHEYAHDSSFLVLDGATADISGTLYFAGTSTSATYGHNNTIRVAGAGSSLALETLYQGYSAGSTHNHDNRLEVLDGAVFTANQLYVGGNGNGVVISNATVSLSGGGIKENASQSNLGTNFFVRLQGITPRFTTDMTNGSGGRNILSKSFKLIYDLPVDGYAADHTPVQFLYTSATDGSLEVEINGIEAALEGMERRGVYRQSMVLMSASGGWSANQGITSAMVERWNSGLPEGASLKYADNALVMTLKRKGGFILSFR